MNDDTWNEVKLAWAKGETIQYFGYATQRWNDWTNKNALELAAAREWRVKPKPTLARLTVADDGTLGFRVWYPNTPEPPPSLRGLVDSTVRWLGPWQEVPE